MLCVNWPAVYLAPVAHHVASEHEVGQTRVGHALLHSERGKPCRGPVGVGRAAPLQAQRERLACKTQAS